jgi:hypothetical protein
LEALAFANAEVSVAAEVPELGIRVARDFREGAAGRDNGDREIVDAARYVNTN